MIYAVLGYSIIMAIFAVCAYRLGLRDGVSKAADKPLQPVITARKNKPHKPSETEKRIGLVWDNVSAYDGTAAGQKKVK